MTYPRSSSKILADRHRALRAMIIAAREPRMSAGAYARATADTSQSIIRGTR